MDDKLKLYEIFKINFEPTRSNRDGSVGESIGNLGWKIVAKVYNRRYRRAR